MARDRDLVDVPVGLAIAAGDVLEDLAGGSHRFAQRRVGDGTEGTAAEVAQGVRLTPKRLHCSMGPLKGLLSEGELVTSAGFGKTPLRARVVPCVLSAVVCVPVKK